MTVDYVNFVGSTVVFPKAVLLGRLRESSHVSLASVGNMLPLLQIEGVANIESTI